MDNASTEAGNSFEPKQMSPPQVNEDQLLTRRVHILGMGSIGTLIAHSLRILPNSPPISLMFHREEPFLSFKALGSWIQLVDLKSDINDRQYGYSNEVRQPGNFWQYYDAKNETSNGTLETVNPRQENEILPSDETFIYCLIVTVKAQTSVLALSAIKHRVDSRSTICLMQNGLGQVDELNEQVFTDPATRPTFLIGVISHGCYLTGPTTVVHAGFGVTSVAIYRDTDKYPLPPKALLNQDPSQLPAADRQRHFPTDEELYSESLSARFLLRTLTRSTVLACAAYPYLDLLMLQLEKLSCNALLNTLTALYDVPNGQTLASGALSIVQNLLLAEISLVIRSLPELQAIPAINQRFSARRLKDLFTSVAEKTAKNSSSMREDVRKGRPYTEIDYINGYIVKRGEELGIRCALNFMLVQMVKAKTDFKINEDNDAIPFMTSQPSGQIDWDKVGEEGGVVLEDVGSQMEREIKGDGI